MMRNKQFLFFATSEDFQAILKEIEEKIDIHYFLGGLHDATAMASFKSIFETKHLGVVEFGDWNRISSYLVMPIEESLNIRDVPQRTGGIKYAVDQMMNPKSIEFKPGGIYKEGVLVAGRIATISGDIDSMNLFKIFSSMFKKNFIKIDAFYVSKVAIEKLKSGWRLVTDEKFAKEYDLKLW